MTTNHHIHLDTVSVTGKVKLPEEDRAAHIQQALESILCKFFPFEEAEIGAYIGKPNFYDCGYQVRADGVTIGHIAIGGNKGQSELDSYQCYYNATGCACMLAHNLWGIIADTIDEEGQRLSRADVAADFVNGEHDVDEAVALYQAGAFDSFNGIRPIPYQAGNWITDDTRGRTFYVGSRANSIKFLRVYEKGKQLGDPNSPWVRWEVEFKRQKGYEISTDILRNPAAFWTGAYKVFQRLKPQHAARKLEFLKRETQATYDKLKQHMVKSYGRLMRTCLSLGLTLEELTHGVPDAPPRRLMPGTLPQVVTPR